MAVIPILPAASTGAPPAAAPYFGNYTQLRSALPPLVWWLLRAW
jgi:hypothetical protein